MKSKTRRKMTFRRFAYYLLIAAIVVSCVANGIFAKFTTEDDGGDGARVAKFGIVLSVSGDLFSTTYNEYAEDNAGNETANSNMPAVFTEVDTDDGISVQARYKYVLADGTETDAPSENATYSFNNVVAPGTKNDEGINISIQGTAETDCVISYEINMSTICLKTWDVENTRYDDVYYEFATERAGAINYSYCVMMPVKENVIREDNFEEFKNQLFMKIEETDAEGNTSEKYIKISSIDADDATLNKYLEFCNDDGFVYYKAVDEKSAFDNDYYMPIVYNVDGNTLSGHTSDDIDEIFGMVLYNPYEFNERAQYNSTSCINKFTHESLGKAITANVVYDDWTDPLLSETFPYKGFSKGESNVIETGKPINIDLDVTWEWPFEDEDTDDEDVKMRNDADTVLGHLVAGDEVFKSLDGGNTYVEAVEGEDYNLEIEFDINITINQVD